MRLTEYSQQGYEKRRARANQKSPFKTVGILSLSFLIVFFLTVFGAALYARYHGESGTQSTTNELQTSHTESSSSESQENIPDLLGNSDALYDDTQTPILSAKTTTVPILKIPASVTMATD